MNVDVLITSCARPDVLEKTVRSFKEKIVTEHTLRYVLVEDKVDNEKRQNNGKKWINRHKDWFDEIIFNEKRSGKGFWWQNMLKYCKTQFHIHLEDDNEFVREVNIDPVLKVMEENLDIVEVIFSRGRPDKRTRPRNVKIGDVKMIEMDTMSIASGLYNTELTKKILDKLGWETMVHEAGNLTPTSNEFGFRKFVLGKGKRHYDHIGAKLGYKKGKWKR
jgi:hypothetical protein